MESIVLEVSKRELGKKATKAVRGRGNVPCVLYGHDAEPIHFEVPELSLRPLIYTHDTHTVEVKIDGKSWSCILRAIDFNPITDRPAHADFQLLRQGETIRITVPIRLHGTPVGQLEGGVTQVVLTELEIECLPKDIPGHVDLDIANLNIGDNLHVSDLELENLTVLTSPNVTIVTVAGAAPEIEEEVEELEEGEELEGSAEGEEGDEDESSEDSDED